MTKPFESPGMWVRRIGLGRALPQHLNLEDVRIVDAAVAAYWQAGVHDGTPIPGRSIGVIDRPALVAVSA